MNLSTSFAILMGVAMLAVLASLAVGIVGMVRGGAFNRRYGNLLMRARVGLQGAALLFFVLALLVERGG